MSGAPLNTAPQETLEAGREQGQCRINAVSAWSMDQIFLLHAEKGVANGFIVVVWTGGRVVKGLALSFIVQIVIRLMDLMRAPTETEQHLRERRRAVLGCCSCCFAQLLCSSGRWIVTKSWWRSCPSGVQSAPESPEIPSAPPCKLLDTTRPPTTSPQWCSAWP